MYLLRRILKTILTILLIGAIVFGLVYGGIYLYNYVTDRTDTPDTEEPSPEEPEQPEDPTAIRVETITITAPKTDPTPTPDPFTIQKTGLVIADQEIQIVPEIGAKITELTVREGEEIEAGTTIAKLGDSTQVRQLIANYNSANEQLKIAENTLRLTEQSGQLSTQVVGQQIQSAQVGIRQAIVQLNAAQELRRQQFFVEDLQRFEQTQQTEASSNNPTDQTTLNSANLTAQTEERPVTRPLYENTTPDFSQRGPQPGTQQAQRYLQQRQGQIQDLGSVQQIESAQLQLEQLATQLESTRAQSELQKLNSYNQIVQIRNQIEQAQISLSALEITSPIAGVVSDISVRPGSSVNPGQAIATITNFDSIVVETTFTPQELSSLNDKLEINISLGSSKPVAGQIINIAVVADPVTKTIPVQIVPKAAPQFPLIPNTFATVTLNEPTPTQPKPDTQNLPSLPLNVVRFENKQAQVPTVKDGKVTYVDISIAKIANNRVFLKNTLPSNTQIIISPRLPEANTPIINE